MRPRLLVIMGSGETTPTMAKLHRHVLTRVEGMDGPDVVVDTPYGFQTNAPDITARALAYFHQSTGMDVKAVSLRRVDGARAQELEQALGVVGDARWVFSGPGSPTYAVRQWDQTVFPKLLIEKLAHGGAVVFASAAAMTLGRWVVPVYEIYKAGGDVAWGTGLGILSQFGMNAAVIAHFDNAEGGNHDTRYCYLGETRLGLLEKQLPEDAWVLGVDEHTACVIDLEAGSLEVTGLGSVTIRASGSGHQLRTGESIALDTLPDLVARLASARAESAGSLAGPGPAQRLPSAPTQGSGQVADRGDDPDAGDPLLAEVRRLSAAFDDALAQRDAGGAMEAVFTLEDALRAWSADTFESDHVDRARVALRRMLARLGELAAIGLRDPRNVVAPWVDALLDERSEARQSKRFADGDRIRDRLVGLGIEVQDSPEGSQWELRPGSPTA